jgi:hypothetical protein
VHLDGITGAALAHLVLFVPFAFAYLVRGTAQLEMSGAKLLQAVHEVAVPVAGQLLATAATFVVLESVTAPLPSAVAAAAVGAAFLVGAIVRFRPALTDDCRRFVHGVAGGPGPEPATTS